MTMNMSKQGIDFLIREEGERLCAYRDIVGIWTIGVGHTGWVDDKRVCERMRISQEKSREILLADLRRFERAVNNEVVLPLSQHQFDALVSLAFNIGEGAFLKSTLLKKLNQGDYSGASEQILAWKYAGGRPVLLRRRKREKALFDRGVYA